MVKLVEIGGLIKKGLGKGVTEKFSKESYHSDQTIRRRTSCLRHDYNTISAVTPLNDGKQLHSWS